MNKLPDVHPAAREDEAAGSPLASGPASFLPNTSATSENPGHCGYEPTAVLAAMGS